MLIIVLGKENMLTRCILAGGLDRGLGLTVAGLLMVSAFKKCTHLHKFVSTPVEKSSVEPYS